MKRLLTALTLFTAAVSAQADPPPHDHDYFAPASGLRNARIRFESDKTGRVAFLGGSITHMAGWRDLTCEGLKKRFPRTEFDFVQAGIPSIDSTGHAFRLERDVFGRGKVDLLFLEASVNDLHNGRTSTERIRAMEGIVRHARRLNPAIDIVILCFVDVPYVKAYTAGETPEIIADHLKVADYYKLPSIDLAKEVTERINAGEFEWAKFRDCHPSPFGHALYHASIERLFDAVWAEPLASGAQIIPAPLPDTPLDGKNYGNGRYIELEEAELVGGWKLDPKWRPSIPAGTRPGFVAVPMLVADEPGAVLKLKFSGTAVGLFVVAGPDAGSVDYSIDGGPMKSLDQFTRWSKGLYLPWPYVLDADLEPGEHELILTTAKGTNPRTKGSSTRIVRFFAN